MDRKLTHARLRAGVVLSLAIAGVVSVSSVRAADIVKLDNADALQFGSAWSGGLAPGVTDVALFNDLLVNNALFSLGAAQSWGGIRVGSPASNLTINTTAALTLGNFGVDMSAATRDLTITGPVTIGGGAGIYNWNVAAGRTLTLSAPPTKLGMNSNHLGLVRFGTTGTINLTTPNISVLSNDAGNPYALYGNNDWAATNASGQVVAATYALTSASATPGQPLLGSNVDVDLDAPGGASSNGFINSMRFNDPTPRTFVISNSGTSRTLTARGILVTENSGGGIITNAGGGLTANNGFIRNNRTQTTGINRNVFPIIQNSAADFEIRAVIANGSSNVPTEVLKYGPGKLILSGPNGHSGGTTIIEGTVEVGGTVGTLAGGEVRNFSNLVLNRSAGTLILNQVISGTGVLRTQGAGVYELNGVNTYTGATQLNGGTAVLGNAASFGATSGLSFGGGALRHGTGNTNDITTLPVTINAGGATIDTNANNVTYANAMNGAGGLTKIGDGVLTLAGANGYAGTTTVNAGRVNVTGSLAGGASVGNGGTLGGSGTIAGTTTVNTSGIFSPGNSVGTLTTGSLSLNAGSILNYEFSTSPAANDLTVVTNSGGLSINGGGLNLLVADTVNPFGIAGTYNIFQYSGAIGGTGVSSLSVLNQLPGFAYSFDTSGGFVRVIVTSLGTIGTWTLDGNGSWGTSGNWSGGIPNGGGDSANFTLTTAANRTITLDGNRTLGGLTLNNAGGYTITPGSGGSLTIGNGTNNALAFAQVGSHAINANVNLASTLVLDASTGAQLTLGNPVSGAGGITKLGGGTLVLGSASNTYNGANNFSGGVVQVAGLGSLGNNAALNLSGGAVVRYAAGMTNDLSTAKTVTLGAGGGGIDTNGNNVTFNTSLPGTGGLVKAGAGTLTLAVPNAYTGATTIRGGVLSVASNDRLGDPTVAAAINLNGGELDVTTGFTLADGGTNHRPIVMGTSGGAIRVANAQTLLTSGGISGNGLLTKRGPGTLNSAISSTNTGGFKLEEGTAIQQTANAFGTGQVELAGGLYVIGATTLANNLLVSGTATVQGGSGGGLADLRNVSGPGTLTVEITSGVFDLEGDMNGLTGTISFLNNGSSAVRLFGTTNGSPNATWDIGLGTGLARRGTITTINLGAVTGQGNINAVNAATGGTTYVIGGKNIDAQFDGIVGDSLDTSTLAIIGATSVTKVGTGRQTFNGQNFYTGNTIIQAGTLQMNVNSYEPVLGGPVMQGLGLTSAGADIRGGRLVLDYNGGSSPASQVFSLLDAGFDVNFASGLLRSTTLEANRILGWVENTTAQQVTVAYVLPGDFDLSGTVNFGDLLSLARNYNLATGAVWAQGDVNYDGAVGFADLLALARNYNLALTPSEAGQLPTDFAGEFALAMSMVPEPATLSVLGVGAVAMLSRRRRRA